MDADPDNADWVKRVSSNEGSDRVNQPREEFGETDWFAVDMDSLMYVVNIRMFGSKITHQNKFVR